MAEVEERVEQDLHLALQIQKNISLGLDILKNSVSILKDHLESSVNQAFLKQLQGTNGTIPCMQHVQAGKQQFENTPGNFVEQVKTNSQQMVALFESAYCTLERLVTCLTIKVKDWQSQFQLCYAKLMAQPDLEKIAPWCAKVGQILHELLGESFEAWHTILKSVPVNDPEMFLTEHQRQRSGFQSLMTRFIQSTFVVSEQADFSIKTLKKYFPTIRIRVLAADYIYDHSGAVKVYFASEPDLKQCFHGDNLDIETLEEKEIKTVLESPTTLELKSRKGTDKMECCFENLHFEQPFKRQKAKEMKVYEDKYRVVFVTQIESETYLTISLPLVVISASNQEIDGLASIMWQCTSTDVFSIEEETPAEMKWSAVAWMLKQKLSLISQSHNLTEDNITHLKNRLFGEENKSDDDLVSLTQFCSVEMQGLPKEKFSFWKWFLGIFNVIEDYLLPYWNDGLIKGFVKRKDAARMLLQCERSGTFILRFADTELNDRDGLKNVEGLLKASVLCINLNTTKKMGKRNSTGQLELTEKKIENLDLPDPPEKLANILDDEKKLFYCYLYPSDKSRKELFNKYYEEKKEESTLLAKVYTDPSKVGPTINDLQQTFREISLIKEIGSSLAEHSLQSEPRIVKKSRRSDGMVKSDEVSINGQTDISSDVSTQNHSPLNLVQNTCDEQSPEHLGYLDQSPTQSVPNHTFQGHFTKELNQDAVVPDSPDRPLLPTVVEDMDVLEPSSNNFCYRKKFCKKNAYQKNLDKTSQFDSSPREQILFLDTPAVEIASNQKLDSILGSLDKSSKMGGDSAAVGEVYVSNERTGMAVHDGNMTVGGASSKEESQSVNDLILSLGGTSTHDGRDKQALVDTATSVVGAGGSAVSKDNATVVVSNFVMSIGRDLLSQVPNQVDGQTFQEVDNCGASKVHAPQNQQVPLAFSCLEAYSKLSPSTLSELKQTLKPDQFRQVLLWTQIENDEVETGMPVTIAVEFGEEIADIEADSPFHQNAELCMENATTFAEHENSLDGLLNADLLNDDTIPDLQDFDMLLDELETK
ncbi:signal transducer and activator of transcription 3.1-like [Mercenaria mercenaria]|uniref:signal transducer and activator of transcription 3.1-like n=1 Tax=Mercenaria mercenaria TaxID=6596 RepID=UPI00234FA162|nr:signal transducer and activator of transcription 3.1-like [Mercenaria mercenaria]